MTDVLLERTDTGPNGTFGVLITAGWEFACFTVELPWLDNQRDVSCIPEGLYECRPWDSVRFSPSYILMDVPVRSHILIHSGNTIHDIRGCIAVGTDRGVVHGLPAVVNSQVAMRELRLAQGMEPFNLMIRWG